MRIRLLGTGTPTPSLERMSSGYLIEIGQRKILFDCGPGVCHRLLQAGIKPVEITDVFFSHLHYDHCLDLVRLLMTHWDQGAGRFPELNVYGPEHTQRMTELIVGDDGIFGPDIRARTELGMSQDVFVARGGTLPRHGPRPVVRELESGERIDCGDFIVTVRSVLHAQPVLETHSHVPLPERHRVERAHGETQYGSPGAGRPGSQHSRTQSGGQSRH
jgi:ribonuclease BN (tRNA processing enzyme)